MSAIEPVPVPLLRYLSRPTLLARAALLAVTLLLEKYFLNLFIDMPRADAAQGFGELVRDAQHIGFSFAITLAVSLAVFVLVDRDGRLAAVSAEARRVALRPAWLGLHLVLLAALAASLTLWFGPHPTGLPLWVLVSGSSATAAAAIGALITGLAPLELWHRGAAALARRWLYAGAAAAIAAFAESWSQDLWGLAANTTFALVRECLTPFVPSLYADPTTRVLAAHQFAIQVQPFCSGLEGVGLMLTFSSAWLIYFRKEYLFPRALVLIPAGVTLIFGLNALRIAALLLIGAAGYPGIAIYGFHSQAGWIAFNIAACALAWASRSSPWLNRIARERSGPSSNPTVAYLLPFVLALAAGAIAHALSAGFETWYGLRLLAAGAGLAFCWRPLAALDWRFGWRGIGVGAAVFVLWLAAARVVLERTGMPAALVHMTAPERVLWISIRVATSVAIVPVIEELAYRGYLLRRLVAADFETVPWTAPGWGPLVLSAVAFAVMHDVLWWPALAAGIAYGFVLVRRGRFGESVAAHAVTNALLAVCVLGFGQWQLWS
ncbi:MAG TPA: exosortase E/protease, VPEID-CTERM system [Steroidobacteraceae bacterium]|nr:exosortase E/protease, VPEID-CTERM system [Steroidobacteraceae bacterium]